MRPTHYRGEGDAYSLGSYHKMNWTGRVKTITGGPYPAKFYEDHRRFLWWDRLVWVHEDRCKEFDTERTEITYA